MSTTAPSGTPETSDISDRAPHCLVEQRGHVLIVTMNRPEARNALSGEMMAIMTEAWDRVDNDPEIRVDVWGPVAQSQPLQERLNRYLSPPLFPVRVRDLANVAFHDVAPGTFHFDGVEVTADLVSHPGPTLGYRLDEGGRVLTYLPDHEPALGAHDFPNDSGWTSGYALAKGADVLIHDSQYTDEEYAMKVGWGHSTFEHVLAFAELVRARHLVTFHHDPSHTDTMLDEKAEEIRRRVLPFAFTPGIEGATFRLSE